MTLGKGVAELTEEIEAQNQCLGTTFRRCTNVGVARGRCLDCAMESVLNRQASQRIRRALIAKRDDNEIPF